MLKNALFGQTEPAPLSLLDKDNDGGAVDDDILGEVILSQRACMSFHC